MFENVALCNRNENSIQNQRIQILRIFLLVPRVYNTYLVQFYKLPDYLLQRFVEKRHCFSQWSEKTVVYLETRHLGRLDRTGIHWTICTQSLNRILHQQMRHQPLNALLLEVSIFYIRGPGSLIYERRGHRSIHMVTSKKI